jgi:tetratricopeptide (TPR) repeat protein
VQRRFGWAAALVLVAGCQTDAGRAARFVAAGESLYNAGDPVRAALELKSALQLEPRQAQALYLLALIAEGERDYPTVLRRLQEAVAADPRHVDARIKLGNYHAVAGRIDEARAASRRALELAPGRAAVWLLAARVAALEGDAARAEDAARKALALDPARSDAVTLLASVQAGAGRHADALATIDAALGVAEPSAVEGLERIRVSLLGLSGDRAATERALLGLAARYPASPIYELALADLYLATGRAAESEQRIRGLILREPQRPDWRLKLAALHYMAGSPAEAERTLRAAIDELPQVAGLGLALAGLLEGLARPEQAIAVYRTIAAREPKGVDGLAARVRIARLDAKRNDALAQAGIASVLADAPGNTDARLLRAALSLRNGRPGEALADLRSILAREPDVADARLLLDRALAVSGDRGGDGVPRDVLQASPQDVLRPSQLFAPLAGPAGADPTHPRKALRSP